MVLFCFLYQAYFLTNAALPPPLPQFSNILLNDTCQAPAEGFILWALTMWGQLPNPAGQ